MWESDLDDLMTLYDKEYDAFCNHIGYNDCVTSTTRGTVKKMSIRAKTVVPKITLKKKN